MRPRNELIAAMVGAGVLMLAAAAWAGPTRQIENALEAKAPASKVALPQRCAKQTIAGHKWTIVVSNFTCGTATGIVRRLATKRVPAKRAPYPGTYNGVQCVGGPTAGALPKSIICGKKGNPFPAVSALRGV